jgi:hypothetical protein
MAFDAAAGHMPPGDIGVPNQKNPPFAIEAGGAHADRHAAGQHEIDMQRAAEQTHSQTLPFIASIVFTHA